MAATRPQPKLRAFECPNCGGAMQLRGMGTALSAVCPSCLSILDVSDERVKIAQTFNEKISRCTPRLDLGSRGKFDGHPWEITGFQRRAIMADGEQYTWDEYVLYNPFRGFRYLTEYNGHWNDVTMVVALPQAETDGAHAAVAYESVKYRRFQQSTPETIFVLGEFPWRVKIGDKVTAIEYVAPPFSLASETYENETTWSKSRYVSGADVYAAFGRKDSPPSPHGVYSNQPNPYGSSRSLWVMFGLFSIIFMVVMMFTAIHAAGNTVFQSRYSFTQGAGEPSFVTPTFELKGGEKNVEVDIKTDLTNDWAFFGLALINEDTGTAYDFGREISYYSGRDSDGSWSEGDQKETASIGGVPSGRYYLRVEPEMEKTLGASVFGGKHVNYELIVRRDVAVIWPYFVLWPFLAIPPFFAMLRRAGMETKRWAESDPYGSAANSSGDDEEDDD